MLEVEDRLTTSVQPTGAGLQVIDLRKSFSDPRGNKNEVLKSVMLEVSPGESVAIIGASGSGKSTLLHLLGGIDSADHGSIVLQNTEIGRLFPRSLPSFRQKQIGLIFQFHYLLPELTAVENVAMPLLIARSKTKDAFAAAHRMLAEIGLQAQADYPVTQLSGGEQQRVAVARALIQSPALILADEPTGNLDSDISQTVGAALVDYARRNAKMTLIATHNEQVARLCDRILELKGGRLVPASEV